MARSEQELQNELVGRYLKNLEFLKTYDIDLFNKIELLSNAINQGLYEEKYSLEFIKELNTFDIFDKQKKKYLYDKKYPKINHNLQKDINFEKKGIFSTLNKSLYKNFEKSYELPETKFKLLDDYLFEDMSEYKQIFSDIKDEGNYTYIDKMMFLGTSLGGHIDTIIKKISPKLSFIYEPDLEVFRLSLFVTDYHLLSQQTKIIFSVMDYSNTFQIKLDQFISSYAQFSNYNVKYSKMSYITDDTIHNILSQLHLSNSNLFDYTKVLYDTIYSSYKHINNYNILTTKKKTEGFSLVKNKPVLFVGAGPSLTKNINWLRKNQKKFIIVSMGATYKKLFENDIKVDIVTTVDPQYEILNRTHFNEEDVVLLKDTIVIASISTPTKILNRFNKEKLFLFETYQAFKEKSNAYNGASIGEVTLSILLDINIENIYLLGIDLAIDMKTGSSHYEGYENQKKALDDHSKVNSVLKGENTDLKDEYLEVKGNTLEKTITTRIFALSINQYTKNIHLYKKENQNIYNLSKEGAYIEGTEYINIDTINTSLESKNTPEINLLENLTHISELGLNGNELYKLSTLIDKINKLYDYIQVEFKTIKVKNIEEFNKKLDLLIQKTLECNNYTLSNIIGNYLNFSLTYIYASLNNNKLSKKNEQKKLKKVDIVLIKHLEKIVEAFYFYLKNIKKPKSKKI